MAQKNKAQIRCLSKKLADQAAGTASAALDVPRKLRRAVPSPTKLYCTVRSRLEKNYAYSIYA